MYARAILNSIATYQLINKGSVEGKYTYNYGKISNGNVTLTVDYDENVVCNTIQVYADGVAVAFRIG